MSNYMKIRPVEAELVHAERQTDRHEEIKSPSAILRKRLKTLTHEPLKFREQMSREWNKLTRHPTSHCRQSVSTTTYN